MWGSKRQLEFGAYTPSYYEKGIRRKETYRKENDFYVN